MTSKNSGLLVGVVIVLIAVAGVLYANGKGAPSSVQGCTTEAMLCPDGSAVGRSGPNCAFADCPAVATTTVTTTKVLSGVRGTVLLGPTCPVMREPPDSGCADKPYATAISVYRKGTSAPYLIGNSDKTGAFQLNLPPGSYTLQASDGTTLPRCGPVDVIVASGAYATADISCDSGIR